MVCVHTGSLWLKDIAAMYVREFYSPRFKKFPVITLYHMRKLQWSGFSHSEIMCIFPA